MKAEDVATDLEQIARQWDTMEPPRGGGLEREQAAAIRAVIEERDALRAEVARLRDRAPVVNLSADDVWELRCKP